MSGVNDGGSHAIAIAIGGLPIGVRCATPGFIRMLEHRYAGFLSEPTDAGIQLDIDLQVAAPPKMAAGEDLPGEDLEVRYADGRWTMQRGDFRADWDPEARRGRVRQEFFPYAIDAVLRILHSLELAKCGGFLAHSASAVRNGRAFLFAGLSGAGKTTISRLAPPDVTLLTDEISCVRRDGEGYQAFGTPFAGELGIAGDAIAAPVAGLYLLAKGQQNRTRPMSPGIAARHLLRNILFFAKDDELVEKLFHTACEFVSRVPVHELTFRPDPEVWNLIR